MLRKSRLVAIGLGASLSLAALAVAFIGIPVGWMISPILAKVNPALAESIKIESSRIKLFPFLTFVAQGVEISDPQRRALKLAKISGASFHLSFAELLSGEPQLRSITLSGLTLYVAHMKLHAPAWERGEGVQIERVSVENGSVVMTNASGQENTLIKNVNAEFEAGTEGEARIGATGEFGSQAFRVSSSLGSGRRSSALFPMSVTVDIGQGEPALFHSKFLLSEDLSSKLISCRTISGAVQGEAFDALATIDRSSRKPSLAVTADFGRLTFDGAEASPDPNHANLQISHILDVLNGDLFDLTFQTSAREFKAPGLELAPAFAEGTLADGVLSMEVSKTKAYGGNLSALGSRDGSGRTHSSFRLTGASMAQFLSVLNWPVFASGGIDADGHLQTAASPNGMRDISGEFTFKIRDGLLKTPHFLAIAQTLLTQGSSQQILNADGELPFSFLSGKARVEHGIAASDDIVFQSSFVRASGRGKFNVASHDMLFVFYPEIGSGHDGNKEWRAVDFPFEISGSLEEPRVAVDLAGTKVDVQQLGLGSESRKKILDAIQQWGTTLFGVSPKEEKPR